jgi:hypothetical protein
LPEEPRVLVLSRETNSWVVQVPGRKFPAIVIQGDTLKVLCGLAEETREAVGPASDAWHAADDLVKGLQGLLGVYERTLSDNGLETPYPR